MEMQFSEKAAQSDTERQLREQLDHAVTDFRNLQKEVNVNSRKRLQATQQLHENEMVQNKLALVDQDDDETGVYKLVGPCLVKQDIAEARANVAKRLEFIQNEVSRSDAAIASAEQKMTAAEGEITKLQQRVAKAKQIAAAAAQ